MDPRRELWVPEYEVRVVEVMGPAWPDILVEKWERNLIGEKRFVEVRTYKAPQNAAQPPVEG